MKDFEDALLEVAAMDGPEPARPFAGDEVLDDVVRQPARMDFDHLDELGGDHHGSFAANTDDSIFAQPGAGARDVEGC
jgi:hypothetical protein